MAELEESVFEDVVDDPSTVSSDALVEDSFSSFVGGAGTSASTSTPLRPAARSRRGTATGRGTARSSVPLRPRLPCTLCNKTYASERTLQVHMKVHAIRDISQRVPSLTDCEKNLRSNLIEALADKSKMTACGNLADEVRTYASAVLTVLQGSANAGSDLVATLSVNFHSLITDHKSLFPSAIKTSVYVGCNKLLNSEDFLVDIQQKFLAIHQASANVLNVFVASLIMSLSNTFIIFVMGFLQGGIDSVSTSRKKRSSETKDDDRFIQLVYYIAGSIISGILWRGNKFKVNSATWSQYIQIIQSKFLANDENRCEDSVRSFTDSIDRGGLKHISSNAFNFFFELFNLIMDLEGSDGSLPLDAVTDQVLTNNSVMTLWDILVGGSILEEEGSINLLMKIVSCCVKVVAKGIIKRHLNELLAKPVTSVPLRSRLTR